MYSWWSMRFRARERNAGWRIDYFLVSDRVAPNIKEAGILMDIMGSDHCPDKPGHPVNLISLLKRNLKNIPRVAKSGAGDSF